VIAIADRPKEVRSVGKAKEWIAIIKKKKTFLGNLNGTRG